MSSLSPAALDLLADIEHNQALSEKHAAKARTLLAQYRSVVNGGTLIGGERLSHPVKPIKSLTRWVDWLGEHGPTKRQTIIDTVGPLTGNAPNYVIDWERSMAHAQDFRSDTLLRITAPNGSGAGQGRPSDVYFLWSQRFDVRPLFGVGPVRSEPDPEPMLGVIQPEGIHVMPDAPQGQFPDLSEPSEPKAMSFQTGPEWATAHGDLFASIATGTKPTDEQRQLLRDTAPPGVDVLAAIALAASGRVAEIGVTDG